MSIRLRGSNARWSVSARLGLVVIGATWMVTACGSAAAPASSANPTTSAVATTSVVAATPVATPTPAPVPVLGVLPTAALDASTAKRLQTALDAMVKAGAPDAIAAVITKDGIWSGAAGIDGPNAQAASAADRFAIASVSKTFTAATIMRLVEQGKMDLEQPLASYLKGIDADANGSTVRQALAMRSGMGDSLPEALTKMYADCLHVWTPAETASFFGPVVGPPGTTYYYSNPSYKLLGDAAMQASGLSLADLIRTSVLDPVGADGIMIQGDKRPTPKPWALPLAANAGAMDIAKYGQGDALPCRSDATFSGAASGLSSDVASLARWGWQLFADKVVSPASLAAMLDMDADGNGLGIEQMMDFGGDLAYGKGGSKAGYASILTVLPERQIVVAVFINEEQADVAAGVQHLLNALGR